MNFSRTEFPPGGKSLGGRPKGSGKGLSFHKPFPMEERISAFWRKVKIGLPHECWPWMGLVDRQTGYGRFCWSRKVTSAQRFAWLATFGDIPFGLFVCHKCDNRICQNPSHLWLGTAGDNNRDMFRKGRGKIATQFRSKITGKQAQLVRSMWVPYKFSVRKISQILKLPYSSCEYAVSKHKPT